MSSRGFRLTAANGDEREAIWDIVGLIQGLLIGDKGYISATLGQELERYGIDLQTEKAFQYAGQSPQKLGKATPNCP